MVGDDQEFKASWDHVMNFKLTCATYEEFVLKQTDNNKYQTENQQTPKQQPMPKPVYQPIQTKPNAQHNPQFSHAAVSHLGHFQLEATGTLLLKRFL